LSEGKGKEGEDNENKKKENSGRQRTEWKKENGDVTRVTQDRIDGNFYTNCKDLGSISRNDLFCIRIL
jgi:hypothetical protein